MRRGLIWILLLTLLLPMLAQAQEGTPLSTGSRGDAVVKLQQRLLNLGLTQGEADGIYGSQTAAAVEEAQRLLIAAGYDVERTGEADGKTLELLFDADAQSALLTLRLGSKGTRVKELQTRLVDLGLLTGSIDGAFGANTEAAVRAFQSRMTQLGVGGLTEDGVATPDLLELLTSDLSQYGLQAPIYFDETAPLSLTADHLYSRGCILIDAPTGEVLFEHEADTRLYPASTTKIMTLLLAIEQGDLDRTVTIPASAADIPKDSSLVPVTVGEQMTMRDLLYGLMIRSGNDAANAVAELCAGSVGAFVQRMNERARSLGMSGTHFANPHGYHDKEHYTTARDLATLTRCGLTNADFCQVVTCLNYTMPATALRGPLELQNVYEIFDPASSDYIPGAAGVKSGYTSYAGFCYVGAAQKDGRTLIAVVLGIPTRNRAWMDLRRLFAYGFALE